MLALLASEILAAHRRSTPASTTPSCTATHGDPAYARIDAPANREQKAKLAALSPDDVPADSLAGEPITAKLTDGARQRRARSAASR